MSYLRASTNEAASLPPINLLFAEVQERQLVQPSTRPVRRSSAWPGFPGPDKNALTNSGYLHASPPPPLQVGRRRSAPSAPSDSLGSPSIFAGSHLRDSHSSRDRSSHRRGQRYPEKQERDSPNLHAHRIDQAQHSQSPVPSRPRRESWSDSAAGRGQSTQISERESGRLPPISMTPPSGSPRLYERDTPRPRPREPACHHCAMDQHIDDRRAAVLAKGPVFGESPHAHKQQIPTPLPPAHGHTMIAFQPTPSAYPGRAFGVSMADILDFRQCLKDPDAPVLENGLDQVFLTLEAKGYTTFVQTISGNCPHRRISRFNLAYAVSSAFDAFLKDFPFNPTGLKAAAIVVRSVAELRLVNLYSRDGRVWRVHVAYVV
ncbi:hypothetical protein DFH07DRAFT_816616 [Mycena maculata]|uniref:Uncharacterized protein n=1 Tax=Mycena maculata TaxID=230809 RepID=A0AAD7JC56_9AGAR|nr:hypothetical protein DFH07DRAFT_816616 [Mycena maculata]